MFIHRLLSPFRPVEFGKGAETETMSRPRDAHDVNGLSVDVRSGSLVGRNSGNRHVSEAQGVTAAAATSSPLRLAQSPISSVCGGNAGTSLVCGAEAQPGQSIGCDGLQAELAGFLPLLRRAPGNVSGQVCRCRPWGQTHMKSVAIGDNPGGSRACADTPAAHRRTSRKVPTPSPAQRH